MLARPSTAAFPFLRLDPLAAVLRANQCKCVNELTKSLRTHSAESARAALPAAGMARDQGGGSCLAGRFSAGLCGGRIPQLRPNQGRMHESSRVSPLHRVTRENPWGFLRPNLTKMKLFMPDRRDVTLVGLIVVSNEGPRVARSSQPWALAVESRWDSLPWDGRTEDGGFAVAGAQFEIRGGVGDEEEAAGGEVAAAAFDGAFEYGEDGESVGGVAVFRAGKVPFLDSEVFALHEGLAFMGRENRGLDVVEVDRGERFFDVQVTGPAIKADAVPVEDPIGGVGVLLDLDDHVSPADGVDPTARDEDGVTFFHGHFVDLLGDVAIAQGLLEGVAGHSAFSGRRRGRYRAGRP